VKRPLIPQEDLPGKDSEPRARESPAKHPETAQPEAPYDPAVDRTLTPSVLQRAQRAYGNQASQRIVQRAAAAQRQPQTEEELAPAGGGQPLDKTSRGALEGYFGTGLSDVRVHTDPGAATAADSIDAQAYTAGRDIYFASGMYAPSSSSGQRLLAHEVAHVVQQSSGKQPTIAAKSAQGAKIGAADDPLETDAERKAEGFVSGAHPAELTEEEQRKKRDSTPPVQRQIQRQPQTGVTQKQDWKDQLNELLPGGGLLGFMMRVQTLQDMFGEELPALVGAIYAAPDARQFVKEHGMAAILALGETSLSHGSIDTARARAWLAAKPDRYAGKNIGAVKQERAAVFPDVAGAKKPTFDEALHEGAETLGKAEFGLSAGSARGIDPNDGYDARDFEESQSSRGVLVSKVEPWMAINSLVKNIGKDVPKAGGGTTKWSFDCFDFVTVLRIYAYWRTLSRTEFNTKFGSLQLGFFSKSPMQWQQTIGATKPGEQPFRSGGTEVVPGTMTFREIKIPVGQTWQQVVASAPVGTQITWANQDAKAKCTADPSLTFCPYMYENTTKLGPDSYAAHPMGIVNEQTIKQEMAKAVFEGKPVPPGYIAKNIFISGLRIPIR
jgi:hypothetical protein